MNALWELIIVIHKQIAPTQSEALLVHVNQDIQEMVSRVLVFFFKKSLNFKKSIKKKLNKLNNKIINKI